MKALWDRFEEMFGRGFSEEKAGGIKFWMNVLNDKRITPEKMARGIDVLIDEGGEFAPSLGSFIKACNKPVPPYHKEFEEQAALPKPRNPEVGKSALAKMMEGLDKKAEQKPKGLDTSTPEERALAQAEEEKLIQEVVDKRERNKMAHTDGPRGDAGE